MRIIVNKEFQAFFQEETKATKTIFDFWLNYPGKYFRKLKERETLRIEYRGKIFFIKRHFGISLLEICKNFFQGRLPVYSAFNEWRAIKAFQRVKIPTMQWVIYGERGFLPIWKQSFLVTVALEPTLSLEDLGNKWNTYPVDFFTRIKYLQKLAKTVAAIHEHGMNHRDCYLCHFLLNCNDETIYTIDLHRVQIRHLITKRWQVKDLAGIYFSSMDFLRTKREIYRFLSSYFNKPLRDIFLDHKVLLQEVETRAIKLYFKTWKQKYFSDDAIVSSAWVKKGDTTSVFRNTFWHKQVIVKRYNVKGFWHFLKICWRSSRAKKSFQNAIKLIKLGFLVPRPLAFFEDRFFWFLHGRSYFISKEQEGELLRDFFARSPSAEESKPVISAIQELFECFRINRIAHRDMKATNFIWDGAHLYILDLDALRFYRSDRKFARAHQKDKNRFLKNWNVFQ